MAFEMVSPLLEEQLSEEEQLTVKSGGFSNGGGQFKRIGKAKMAVNTRPCGKRPRFRLVFL